MSSSDHDTSQEESFVTENTEGSSVLSESQVDDESEDSGSDTSRKMNFADTSAKSAVDESFEIPETDEEDSDQSEKPISTRRRTATNRIIDSESEESDDESDKARKSVYEAEVENEEEAPIEEQAYSKATRRSIFGFQPRKSMQHSVAPGSDSDSSDSDSDIIIEDSENESQATSKKNDSQGTIEYKHSTEVKKEMNGTNSSQNELNGTDDSIKSIANVQNGKTEPSNEDSMSSNWNESQIKPSLSSTIRSPLKDVSNHKRSMVSNESFDNSIESKMSSTLSPKEESGLLNEAAGSSANSKLKVSQSQYETAVSSKETIEKQLSSLKQLMSSSNLPDGGEKLKKRIEILNVQLDEKIMLINMMEIDENKSIKNEIMRSFQSENSSGVIVIEDEKPPKPAIPVYKLIDDVKPVHFGKVGMENFQQRQAETIESLKDIHQSINKRPPETELDTPPKYLKLDLMPHQLHAIKFMRWRETASPRGGILADDMGLGKTLTTISLIMKSIQAAEDRGEDSGSDSGDDDDDDGWKARGRKDLKDGGTLIICPASLLKQWEAEIKTRTKRGAIEHYLFHGQNREYKPRYLAKYDVVCTTYQIAVTEDKNNGCLFQVRWKRIVLDEGHVIRNHKSKQSEAVCKLSAKYRWVLTGTPIQNKEFDLYATVKFLRCKPWDDLVQWKSYMESKGKGASASVRVQALLKAIMLRRTKQQLIESGEIETLPSKTIEQFNVTMTREERYVYNKFLAYSQALFASYLMQQQEKSDNFNYDKNNVRNLFKKFSHKFNVNHDVKNHEILTLILRLRQICCHPGLAKSSVEQFASEAVREELEESASNVSDHGILKQLENLHIDGDNEVKEEEPIDNILNADDEVFDMDIPSSKVTKVMEKLREHVLNSDDKAIVVSQWTSYLTVMRGMLEAERVSYCELNGTVAVKDRNDIVVSFNNPNSGIKIMLLSLTAGGVGLNLTGANYLFLMDLHWNPQLEQQAQDRIYRFGQKKHVNVFKFVCNDSIEEQILKIQEAKLDIAESALTGAKKALGSKLSMEDLKHMFQMDRPAAT